ncbi:MAG: PrkA family serine protein kinase [Bdellovibrionota bacterium]
MSETNNKDLLKFVAGLSNPKSFQELNWDGTFHEYLDLVKENPNITRNAFQRMYDMIVGYGSSQFNEYKKDVTKYKFFEDPIENGKDAVFGLDVHMMKLVNFLRSASLGYGTEKRVLLLHGPVGSAKSTIARLLKKGVERYSYTPEGALYTFKFIDDPKFGLVGQTGEMKSPMNEEPLLLIPEDARKQFEEEMNKAGKGSYKMKIKGELSPPMRMIFRELMARYKGDFTKVMDHVKVMRFTLSEKDRIGIGTFQPKDEKNQDSTELTGDINYRKIAEFGSDSDPRAFNFDGEFQVANRGVIEFVEVLKLDVAFLYDLLGASQEHVVKPKKFAQTSIDEVIIGHTNEPEFRKLQNNEFMEALRDRTVKIDVPYITKLHEEEKIYAKDFGKGKVQGVFIAPHTIEMAAMWAILTRLEAPKKNDLSLIQKMKLYNGKTISGYTEDNVKELRKEAVREGLDGISPRYIQDKISNTLVKYGHMGCVNPFMLFNELESGLRHHTLISNEERRREYKEHLSAVKQEYEDIIKNEVQRAISADESAIGNLCANYIDNIKAYTQKEKVRNRYTGQLEQPDERLMRSIEEKIDIPDSRKDDFRREIMNYIGALAVEGKTFDYRTNERLHRALELKLFEDQKDSIKLSSLVSNVVDKAMQEKIDVVKTRLIRDFGYDEISATDILNYVASIFARGDAKERG